MEALIPELRTWKERGGEFWHSNRRVFVLDQPATAERPGATPILVLHGFPSSSFDWHQTLPTLAGARRVVLLDFPGFGFSAKPASYSYSLFEQADVAVEVVRRLGITRVHLVAHDMGTSVACELLARRAEARLDLELASVLLTNGSLYIEMARLTPSQKLLLSPLGPIFARLSTYRSFRWQMSRIVARLLAESEVRAMWQQLNFEQGRLRLPRSIRYVHERRRFAERWLGAWRGNREIPAHVVWGTEDPVAVLAIGERAAREAPGARLERLEGVGHFPMLEAPAEMAAAVDRWVEEAERERGVGGLAL